MIAVVSTSLTLPLYLCRDGAALLPPIDPVEHAELCGRHHSLRSGIVAPDGEIWSGRARMVIAKTLDGDLGVLTGHSPVLGILAEEGVLRCVDGGWVVLTPLPPADVVRAERRIAGQFPTGAAEITVTLDCGRLEYISSAGLGVLLKTQKRLMGSAGKLRLSGVNRHLQDIFVYSGFDKIFEIEAAP